MDKKKVIRKVLTIVFYILIVVFLVYYFRNIDFEIIKNANYNIFFMLLSFTIRMTGLLIMPYSWEVLIKSYHGKMLDKKKIYKIYAESWLGRYIPGKVGWIGGKILFATREGVSTEIAVVTSFLDSILQVFSSMLLAVFIIIPIHKSLQIDNQIIILVYIITAVMLVCLIPPIFNRFVGICYKIIKKKEYLPEYHIKSKTMLTSIGIVVISKVFSSLAVAVMAYAVVGNSFKATDYIYVMAVNLIATAIGMAALFAPAGLGVKESIQIFLLGSILGKENALIIVTMASLQSIVGDIVFFIATRFIKNKEKLEDGTQG